MRSTYRLPITGAATALLLATFVFEGVAGAGDAGAEGVDFQSEIRPLLADRCFKCHGPDENHRKADLRLDVRAGAFADLGGYAAIVPGKPAESELYRRITAADPDDRMPPAGSKKTLSAGEIALIERWIAQGASWEEHWAFVPPVRPEPPRVEREDRVRNPIDRFVIAKLEALGLEPRPEADRRTLIRRVTFDLTGLPPTRAEVEAFVADESPDAYERVVDRLLQSPHYGEHMARYWLDAARYGDTHGLHLDNLRIMWPYRDWVIDAYNRNVSFDRFTLEQLAGDLLPNPTREQRVATGFNRCNVTTSEGGAIDEEFYVRYAVDRVETTATVWMGLTAGCATCHDHKFDPLSQKEFYRLFAYFNNIKEPAMDGNKPSVPPFIEVPLPGVEEELEELRPRIAALEKELRAREVAAAPDFEEWAREAARGAVKVEMPSGLAAHYPLDGDGDTVVNAARPENPGKFQGKVTRVEGKFGRAFRVDGNHLDLGDAGDFEGDQSFSYGAWVKTPGNVTGAVIARMDNRNAFRGWDLYLAGRRVAMHLIHQWSGRAIKVTTKEDVLEPNAWHHLFVTYDGSGKAGGVKLWVDGEVKPHEVNADSLAGGTTRTNVPLHAGKRHSDSPVPGCVVDEIRIYERELRPDEVSAILGVDAIAPILAVPASERTAEETRALLQHYLANHDEPWRELSARLAELRARERELESRTATTLVMEERETRRGAHVLERGQYDRRGEEVKPGTPAFLPPLPEDVPSDRLGFARWLVDPAHPLTARVAVNRLWQQKFGVGLVKTAEDFGSQGEPPSHPELLDWLATEFVRLGWDRKRLERLIVTSATYRQSARVSPELARRDPENRLLARGPRFRLDAEMLRDQALAVSGLLVREIGGPSVKPPQPEGLWYAVGYSGSNTVRFEQDTGEDIYRRSLYTFWKRTAPPPQFATFDAPSRESCTVRRERTNTPLQALFLMNDAQYVESARHLARRALRNAGESPEERARFLFSAVTCRAPEEPELEELLRAYEDHLAGYRAEPEAAKTLIEVGDSPPDPSLDPVDLAAWTLVANLVLNLDEVVTK